MKKFVTFAFHTGSEIGPEFCEFTISPEFLKRLEKLHAVCVEHQLSEAVIGAYPDVWESEEYEDNARLQDGELTMTPSGDFWFSDQPKHSTGVIQSHIITLAEIQAHMSAADGSELVYLTDDQSELKSIHESYLTTESN